MKNFTIKMTKATVHTFTVEIKIEAENEDDARVLAKYQVRDLHSWDWVDNGEVENRASIVTVTPSEEVEACTN